MAHLPSHVQMASASLPTIHNDNMASLSSSKPKLDEQIISQVCGSSQSRENFVANLVREMFSKEERLQCNMSGNARKRNWM